MKKRSFSIAFKQEVIAYIETEKCLVDRACDYFSARDRFHYNSGDFYQWFDSRDKFKSTRKSRKRVTGGGRKPLLKDLEVALSDEIVSLRLMKLKVTRTFVSDRASILAQEHGVEFKGSNNWLKGFLARNRFSLRRTTNFTTLSDSILIQRAVNYMKSLRVTLRSVDRSKTLLMDETPVFFEDTRTQTIDFRGRRHVVMKSTGFSSMRISVVAAVWADGRKSAPMVIHKGKNSSPIFSDGENILYTTQEKAWIEQELLVKWIDVMFPDDSSPGKCIIWDTCSVHISILVKMHCRKRKILLVTIPGGMTSYLQAGDIGIFREFKNHLSPIINAWKSSGMIESLSGGKPKPPATDVVRSWVSTAWNQVSENNIRNSINGAGLADDWEQWFIVKHDVYGALFKDAFSNSENTAVDQCALEATPQDDDIERIELDDVVNIEDVEIE